MDQKISRHEKIRFRRGEINELATFPSAAGQDHFKQRGRISWWVLRGIATAATLLTSVAIIVAGCLYLLATSGISTERLREEAETAIKGFSGMNVDAVLGPARVSVDRSQFLAVEVPDITLKAKADGSPVLEAKTIEFGIRAVPLLSGSIQLGSARVSDARIFAAAFGSGGGADWTAPLKNADGLIDPDQVSAAVFDAAHRLFEAFDVGSTRSIELDNVEVVLPDGTGIDGLRVAHALLSQSDDGDMQFSADLVVDGRSVAIEASASRDAASKRIVGLKLGTTVSAPAEPEIAQAVADSAGAATARQSGRRRHAGSFRNQPQRRGRRRGPAIETVADGGHRPLDIRDRPQELPRRRDRPRGLGHRRREQGKDRKPDDPARPFEIRAVRSGRAKAGRRWPACRLPLRAGQRQFGVGA